MAENERFHEIIVIEQASDEVDLSHAKKAARQDEVSRAFVCVLNTYYEELEQRSAGK